MIQRFVFGHMIETDTVPVKPEAVNSSVPGFTVDEKEQCFSYTLGKEDRVYGLGENVRGINKRGWIYRSWATDNTNHAEDAHELYSAHNFLVVDGEERFGLFLDYGGMVTYDIGYTDMNVLTIRVSDFNLDVYRISGDSVLSIVHQFREMIGRSYIPPRWAFGFGQSRWGYTCEEDIRRVVSKHRELGLPLDSVYMDIDYMDNYKDFTVNTERYPDLAALSAELSDQGIHLIPIIDAAIKKEEGYWVAEEGLRNGYFCTDIDGRPFEGAVWPGSSFFPDVLNPEVRTWFGRQYKTLLDMGIEGFWNDMNEPSIFYTE
ncbi:MAG: alpha-glucosidase, partial [Clostridia bacterium]|nr:alpha-glucosidase [Clostridia bacterium]